MRIHAHWRAQKTYTQHRDTDTQTQTHTHTHTHTHVSIFSIFSFLQVGTGWDDNLEEGEDEGKGVSWVEQAKQMAVEEAAKMESVPFFFPGVR